MSIDQRLRVGLRAESEATPDPTVMLNGWADVQARAERQRTRDRARWAVGTAAAAVLVVIAAVTWWPRGDGQVHPIQPVPSPSVPTPSVEQPPIVDSWSTGPVPAQGIVDHLESVGLGQWADGVLQGVRVGSTIEYRLKLQGGRSTLTMAVGANAAVVQDVQSYDIAGSRVTLTPDGSNCSEQMAWEVQGDRLRLLVLQDDCPPYRGTPDVALMQGLYAAFPFTRVAG